MSEERDDRNLRDIPLEELNHVSADFQLTEQTIQKLRTVSISCPIIIEGYTPTKPEPVTSLLQVFWIYAISLRRARTSKKDPAQHVSDLLGIDNKQAEALVHIVLKISHSGDVL